MFTETVVPPEKPALRGGAGARRPGLLNGTPVWLRLHGALTYLFLYLPVAVLVIYSFSASRSSVVWGGFTADWYIKVWENERLLHALRNSLTLALVSTAIGVAMGTAAALGHARLGARRRSFTESAFYLPLMTPDIVIALALRLYFVKVFAVQPGQGTMIAGHAMLSTCYVFLVTSARLNGFDWRLLEAARDLGANSWQTFRHVLLPFLWPGVAGGALLSLAVSLDEYVIASFLAGPGDATLPVEIAGRIRKSFTPELNALAVLMLLASVLLAILAAVLQHRGVNVKKS